MIDPERPPLHPFTNDGIKQARFRVDQTHWPRITEMRVKKFYPPDEPVPPQLPEVLMGQIRWYASMLFKAEADQYEHLRNDANYPGWLSRLADRVIIYAFLVHFTTTTALARWSARGDACFYCAPLNGNSRQCLEC